MRLFGWFFFLVFSAHSTTPQVATGEKEGEKPMTPHEQLRILAQCYASLDNGIKGGVYTASFGGIEIDRVGYSLGGDRGFDVIVDATGELKIKKGKSINKIPDNDCEVNGLLLKMYQELAALPPANFNKKEVPSECEVSPYFLRVFKLGGFSDEAKGIRHH